MAQTGWRQVGARTRAAQARVRRVVARTRRVEARTRRVEERTWRVGAPGYPVAAARQSSKRTVHAAPRAAAGWPRPVRARRTRAPDWARTRWTQPSRPSARAGEARTGAQLASGPQAAPSWRPQATWRGPVGEHRPEPGLAAACMPRQGAAQRRVPAPGAEPVAGYRARGGASRPKSARPGRRAPGFPPQPAAVRGPLLAGVPAQPATPGGVGGPPEFGHPVPTRQSAPRSGQDRWNGVAVSPPRGRPAAQVLQKRSGAAQELWANLPARRTPLRVAPAPAG